LQRDAISHLELHGNVVCVYRRERLFLRQGEGLDAAREEELPVRRQRGVWLAAAILRRIEAEAVGRARRAAAEGEGAIKVRGHVQALRGENRQVLSHRMAEERTEDPDVVAAAIARADHHFVGGLVCEAQSRGEIDPVPHVAPETGTAEADSV